MVRTKLSTCLSAVWKSSNTFWWKLNNPVVSKNCSVSRGKAIYSQSITVYKYKVLHSLRTIHPRKNSTFAWQHGYKLMVLTLLMQTGATTPCGCISLARMKQTVYVNTDGSNIRGAIMSAETGTEPSIHSFATSVASHRHLLLVW